MDGLFRQKGKERLCIRDGVTISGEEGINVVLYHKQMELPDDLCQFRPAWLRPKDTCGVAAGRHEVDAVYPRIPASCHKPFRGHPIPIRGYGDQLDVQEIGKLLKVCIPKKGQSF